jgi:hypothetical protein
MCTRTTPISRNIASPPHASTIMFLRARRAHMCTRATLPPRSHECRGQVALLLGLLRPAGRQRSSSRSSSSPSSSSCKSTGPSSPIDGVVLAKPPPLTGRDHAGEAKARGGRRAGVSPARRAPWLRHGSAGEREGRTRALRFPAERPPGRCRADRFCPEGARGLRSERRG